MSPLDYLMWDIGNGNAFFTFYFAYTAYSTKKVAEKYSKLEGIFPCYKKLTLVETLG